MKKKKLGKLIVLMLGILILTAIIIAPAFYEIYSSSTGLYFNRTEASNNGVRTTASPIFLDFNSPEEYFSTTLNYTKDSSIYNNFGTLGGTTQPVYNATGGYNGSGAYMFDGINDQIIVYDADSIDFAPTDAFSISYFIKGNKSHDSIPFVKAISNKGYALTQYAGNDIRFILRQDGTYGLFPSWTSTFSGTLWNSQYHHVCLVYNGNASCNDAKLYIDGILQTQSGCTNNLLNSMNTKSSANLYIGSNMGTGYYLNGSMDNIALYRRALTITEVININNTGRPTINSLIDKYNPSGDYQSGVFYNSTLNYWNITLSHSANPSGNVANSNGINLSNPNLVAYWALDSTNGTFHVDVKGMNNGTCSGTTCPNSATGLTSGAMRFDGSNDFINISHSSSLNITQQITYSAWAYFNSITNYGIINKGTNGWNTGTYLGLGDGGNNLAFSLEGVGEANYAWTNLAAGRWYHILGTYNGTSVDLYLNGIRVANLSRSWQNITQNTAPLVIGRESYSGGRWYLGGFVDEVLIYNTSLTASQINQIYKSGLSQHANTNITLQTRTANNYNVSDAGLVSFWALNNDSSIGENEDLVVDLKNKMNLSKTYPYSLPPVSNISGVIGGGVRRVHVNGGSLVNSTAITNGQDGLNSSGTFSLWVRGDDDAASSYLINSHGTGIGYGALRIIYGSSTVNFETGGSSGLTCSKDVWAGKWHHYVLTWNSSKSTTLFLDGVQCGTGVNTYAPAFTRLTIGSGSFVGLTDEVRIYNRSLNATEVLNLYNLGSYHISDWSAWSTQQTCYDNETKILALEEIDCEDVIELSNLNNNVGFANNTENELGNNNFEEQGSGRLGGLEINNKYNIKLAIENGDYYFDDGGDLIIKDFENINLLKENKEKGSKNVTQTIRKLLNKQYHSPEVYTNYKDSNYINVSVYNDIAEDAVVTRMVRGLPYEQYPSPEGSLGSIPSHGASALNFSGKCYIEKWKLFEELDKTEKVATLNPETGLVEYKLPYAYQEYDTPEFMYKIKTAEGDLIVSPEHKVYVGMKDRTYNKYNKYDKSQTFLLLIGFVLFILGLVGLIRIWWMGRNESKNK